MDVNGLVGKALDKSELIGTVAGVLVNGIDPLVSNVSALVSGSGHIPDLGQMIRAAVAYKPFKDAAFAYIGGEILSEFQPRYGNALKKGALGYAKGLTAQHVLYWSTHSPPGHVPNYKDPDSVREGSMTSPHMTSVLG